MSLKRIGRKDAILSGLFPKSTAFSKPAICLIYALAEFHQFDGEVPIRGIGWKPKFKLGIIWFIGTFSVINPDRHSASISSILINFDGI